MIINPKANIYVLFNLKTIAIPEYITIGGIHGWVHLKGHIAYGRFTD